MTTFLLILACLFLYGIMAGLTYVLCQNWGWLGMDDPVDSGTIAVLWPPSPSCWDSGWSRGWRRRS